MTPSLDGINAKLSRAEQHLNALEEAIAEFLEGGLLIGSKFDPVNKGYNVFYNGLGAGFPVGWGAILGDFIHNARSLLDHLVWQLALINNETPDRDNHFPICATEPGFKNDVIHRNPKRGKSPLHGLGPEHVARIQSRQPYVGRTKIDAEATPLFLLNQCWNMDKHQLIHAVQPYVASDVLKVRFEPPEFRLARVEMFIAPGNLLESGTQLAFIQAAAPLSTPPDTKMQLHFRIPASVAFGKPGEMPTVTFRRLKDMLTEVASIILEFAPFF